MTSSENVTPESIEIVREEDRKGQENLNAAEELKKFGPIGRENYKKFAIDIIDEGFKDGTLDRKDREQMWANFARLEAAVTDRLKADKQINPITVLKEELWKIRQDMETAKKLPLDDHHQEVKDYSRKLTKALIEAAKKSGKTLPLSEELFLLLPELMDFHDELKWIAKFGSKDSIAADHEEQMRYLVKKYFVGREIDVEGGRKILITEALADAIAKALGNHENIYEEKDWSQERAKDDDQGNTISLMFLIDTMTNAITIDNMKDTSIVALNLQNFKRFTSLAERHLKLFIGDEPVGEADKNFGIAKAYRPEWILRSSLDFIDILKSWKDKFGVETSTQELQIILDKCIEVFDHARIALAPLAESPAKQKKASDIEFAIQTLEKRRSEILGDTTDRTLERQNEAFFDVTSEVLRDKKALIEIAKATGESYAKRNNKNRENIVLTDDEVALLNGEGKDEIKPVSETDKAVELLAKNSVGFIHMLRLVSLMQADESMKTLSLADKLKLLSGAPSKALGDFVQIGARGAHSGWYQTAIMSDSITKAQVLPYDRRDELAGSSDWIQIQTAAQFALKYIDGKGIADFASLADLYHDRNFMIDCASTCDETYRATQADYYESVGKKVPSWLSKSLFTPEQLSALKSPESKGLDITNRRNVARIKFGENTSAFVALQEEIANIAKLRQRPAADVLKSIIDETMDPQDRILLTTSQKTQYLLIQVYKGRYADKSINLESLDTTSQTPWTNEDWKQLQEAAKYMQARLAEAALVEDHETAKQKRVDEKEYDPANPEAEYQVPEIRELMQTGREGEEQEGYVHYSHDRLQVMVINKEGKVAMKRKKFVAQKGVPVAENSEGLLEFVQMERPKGMPIQEIVKDGVAEGASFGSSKYHDRLTIDVETGDTTLLQEGGYDWYDVSTAEAIDKLIREIMTDCDPSVVAALYRRKLKLQKIPLPPATIDPTYQPQEANVRVRSMETTTGNWFSFRREVDENGKEIEVTVSGNETFALAPVLVNGERKLMLMTEESPALAYHRKTTSTSGGYSGKTKLKDANGKEVLDEVTGKPKKINENSLEAAQRELAEELKLYGEAILIGAMKPNPDTLVTTSFVHIMQNVRELDPAEARHFTGDEVTKIERRAMSKDEFAQAVLNGEVVDDRTIASVYMAFLYMDEHPEIAQELKAA